jgi:hypothetical protein
LTGWATTIEMLPRQSSILGISFAASLM